jgi:glycosyltransferase involved in cell wall biosynthesis
MLLTFIVPFYNVVEFVDELAYSLFHRYSDQIEYIFIDDCSTDGSREKIVEAIGVYNIPTAQIIGLDSNAGPSAARNVGLDIARGEYIWCMDSDDIVNPAAWDKIMSLLQARTADVFILEFLLAWETLQTKFVWKNSGCTPVDRSFGFIQERILHLQKSEKRTMASRRVLRREDGVVAALLRDKMVFTWSVIVKRTLYDGIRFPENRLIEDVSTLPRMFFRAERFYYLDFPVVYYRQHGGSLLGSRGNKLFLDMSGSLRFVKDYLMEHSISLSPAEKLELDTFHLQTLVWAANDYVSARLTRDKAALALLKSNINYFKANSEDSGRRALAHMKGLGRKGEHWAGKAVLFHTTLFFFMRRLYVGPVRLIVRRLLAPTP